MVYWLENVYILTSIRPCQFSEGLPATRVRKARPPAEQREADGRGGQAYKENKEIMLILSKKFRRRRLSS
jgi:hypothetical protein